jgi:hypothetical protein
MRVVGSGLLKRVILGAAGGIGLVKNGYTEGLSTGAVQKWASANEQFLRA